MKKRRTLFTEEHMATVKNQPACNKYMKGNFGHTPVKPLGCYKNKEEFKKTHFTDVAKTLHKQNSVAVGKYNGNFELSSLRPKKFSASMGKKPDKVEPWRIEKSKEPGPGSYPVEEVIRKT